MFDFFRCRVSHSTLVFLCGFLWLGIGCYLLPLGLNFIIGALLLENIAEPRPVLNFLAPYVGGVEPAALIWIAFALLVGYAKGRKVFAKSVKRTVDRIVTLPNPVSVVYMYAPVYYILLASMVGLGIAMKWTPQDVRGGVDIVIGSALIQGALLYFRSATKILKEQADPERSYKP